MGNKLCAPWKKSYQEDIHWTPRKDSHLLRLWAEIFEVQETNGEICWSRVSDDVVPVNITCIQNHPNTIFHITAYNRHVEKIFDVRLVQPGTRITQASECFAHWKDSKCDHEWGLNFTTPLDARRFYDCCMGSTKYHYTKAASSASLGLSPPQNVLCRKAASNPTSPLAHLKPTAPASEEFLFEDDIEAGFILTGTDKEYRNNEIMDNGRKSCQLECENIYTRISNNLEEQLQPSYTIYNIMKLGVAERVIPYTACVTTDTPSCRLTTEAEETGNPKCDGRKTFFKNNTVISNSYDDPMLSLKPSISDEKVRQLSREPSTLNICDMRDCNHTPKAEVNRSHDILQITADELTRLKNNTDDANFIHEHCNILLSEKCEKYVDKNLRLPTGFDSNTLKRMLQTFPSSTQKDALCSASNSLNTNGPESSKQQTVLLQTPIIETNFFNTCHMLPQHSIDKNLQTAYQRQSNENIQKAISRNEANIIVPECENQLNDITENENISEINFFPYRLQQPFTSKSAAIRKTGYLLIQDWLLNKIVTVVLAPRRCWKRFWVCLKGTELLFYDSEKDDQRHKHPRHVLVISGCLAQPHSESLGCIFSISTIFGCAYLFKTSSEAEMNSWIYNIHLACAASFARYLGKESTMKLLSTEIHKLENSIDLDLKMKKMASMQMNVVQDPINRETLNRQIASWDQNLEKLFLEQYQLRCYLSALQGGEFPCTKVLLSNVSDATRANLSVVTPAAFHALVCARMPVTATGSFSHIIKNQDRRQLSTFKADNNKLTPKGPRPISLRSRNCDGNVNILVEDQLKHSTETYSAESILVSVCLPENKTLIVGVNDKTTVEDLLICVCNRCHINSSTYFIRIKQHDSKLYQIPDKSDLVLLEDGETLEVCAKVLFQAEIFKSNKERDFGFSVEAKSYEDCEQELSVYISDIVRGTIKGLHVGDELIVLNDLIVSELDMVYIETILEDCESISVTVRSCRVVDQSCEVAALLELHEEHVDEIGCLSTSKTQLWRRNTLHGDLADNYSPTEGKNEHESKSRTDSLHLLQEESSEITEELPRVKYCLNDSQMCHKVVMELIESERHYVKDLNSLIESYLEPIKRGTFLSDVEIGHLFGNIHEITDFQKIFLQSLEEAVNQEEVSEDLQPKSLFSIGSAFLYYAHHFKLYSSFCASHSKAQKILLTGNNISFKELLRLHNPNQQHCATLESYLIKPIQRIFKYPVLLRQLTVLTDSHSEEHFQLQEALHGMEAVAEHINEMQKIYEEYGNILDEIMRDYRDTHPQAKDLDLNVGELQMYGTVKWLNPLGELGKLKKGMELLTLVFIFQSGVVLMAQECLTGKRKSQHGRPSLCGENTEAARFKIVIPVEQLQVRTMVGDVYECHGVWELVQYGSRIVDQPEKIFQFASSQEARRDFIRTIQHTILRSVNRIPIAMHGQKDVLRCRHLNTFQEPYATAYSCKFSLRNKKRPQSLLIDPLINPYEGSSFSKKEFCREEETETTNASYKNNQENEVVLGSQSTLASDRAGARLVQASYNPTTYSNHIVSAEPIGSPIWKPRQGSKHVKKPKSRTTSEDACSDSKEDEDLEHLH